MTSLMNVPLSEESDTRRKKQKMKQREKMKENKWNITDQVYFEASDISSCISRLVQRKKWFYWCLFAEFYQKYKKEGTTYENQKLDFQANQCWQNFWRKSSQIGAKYGNTETDCFFRVSTHRRRCLNKVTDVYDLTKISNSEVKCPETQCSISHPAMGDERVGHKRWK